MQNKRNTESWNERYLKNDTPWEDGEISPEMIQMVSHFASQKRDVLEIGCGLGTNARWLADSGYNYIGIDISEEAIRKAKQRLEQKGLTDNTEFISVDIFEYSAPSKYDVVFDKGCFHGFTDEFDRKRLVDKIHSLLKPGGYWINISGNRDNPDREGSVEEFGFPRLAASEILKAVEGKFQVHYMARCIYGSSDENTRFLGWANVFEMR